MVVHLTDPDPKFLRDFNPNFNFLFVVSFEFHSRKTFLMSPKQSFRNSELWSILNGPFMVQNWHFKVNWQLNWFNVFCLIAHWSFNFENQPKILIITKLFHRKWLLLLSLSSSKSYFDIITVVKSIFRWLTHMRFIYVFKSTVKALNIPSVSGSLK